MKITDIIKLMIKEQEDAEDEDPEDLPSNVQVMLDRFKILKPVLIDLLTAGGKGSEGDLENLIANIEVIVYKPTTFKIVFHNGSEMNLKYDPTPMQNNPAYKGKYKPKDYFQCQIVGKKYNLGNRSDYQQALDYIADILKNAPVTKATKAGAEEEPEAGGGGEEQEPEQEPQNNGEEEP